MYVTDKLIIIWHIFLLTDIILLFILYNIMDNKLLSNAICIIL